MSYTRTQLQLRTALLQLGGFENSEDLLGQNNDWAPANQFINDALEETYNVCIACRDDFYVRISSNITLTPGTDTYAMPGDFYELRKVEVARDSTLQTWQRLRPIPIDGINLRWPGSLVGKRYRYRLSSLGLTLAPLPQAADTIRVYYIPLAAQLASDGDTVTFDRPVEQKLVLYIALRDITQRSDLPTGELDAKIANLTQQLRSVADTHDAGEPFYLSRTGPHDDDDEDGWAY